MPKASLSADVVLPGRLELCLALYFIPMVVTIFCYWYFMHSMLSLPQLGTWECWGAMGLATVTLFKFPVCLGIYNVSHGMGFFQMRSQIWRVCEVLLSASVLLMLASAP